MLGCPVVSEMLLFGAKLLLLPYSQEDSLWKVLHGIHLSMSEKRTWNSGKKVSS